jgi:multidrug efflux pump subunit AcrA (membrane-fusion protein)
MVAAQAHIRKMQADTEMKLLKVALNQEIAKLQVWEEQMQQCHITSPIDGIVVYHVPEANRFAQVPIVAQGEPVKEGQKLLRICDMTQFQVQTRIHEAQISFVRQGKPAVVRIDAYPEQSLKGQVSAVATVASPADWRNVNVKVYPVTIALEKTNLTLRPGMSAALTIVTHEKKNVLRVPVGCVQFDGRRAYCFVQTGKETDKRQVNPGISDGKFIEIQDGLKEGETVEIKTAQK